MNLSALKYILPLLVYIGAWRSFRLHGIEVWTPIIYAFLFIPLLELFIKPSAKNIEATEEAIAAKNPVYDIFLWLVVPLQFLTLIFFLFSMQEEMDMADRIGRILVMGLLCGIFGINVGHELGHRVNKAEQFMAKALLLTSLYMHFNIEHNRGHHKHVGTPHDPSTAPRGLSLYGFWIRSISGVYRTAWKIANEEQQKKNRQWWQNEMLLFQLTEVALCVLIGSVFGWMVLVYFLISALIGILLLETVNYIEHYGLKRRAIADGKFERAMPEHSWNSDHIIGRLMLFELSRHSDHHYLASRKYQLLRHHENAPQLPTGYPGSMILAMLPPLWFYVMHRRIEAMSAQ